MSNPYEQNPYSQPSAGDPYQQNPYQQNPYQQNPAGGPVAPYGQQPYGMPEHPQGTLILVFGILGLFVGIFAPVAWYMGNKARKEIRASGIQYSNEQQVTIGRVLGMVFTILYIVGIVVMIVAFGLLFVVSSQTG